MPPPSKFSGVMKIISIVWLAGIVLSTLRLMVIVICRSLPGILASARIAGSGGRSLPGDCWTSDQTIVPTSAEPSATLVRSS